MTTLNPHVSCIGIANVDIIADADDTLLDSCGIARGASTLLDSCQTGNVLGKLKDAAFFPGGCAANTACGLSLFGVGARFIGKTGEDIYADIFRKGFAPFGVVHDTPAHTMKMTSTCLTLITPDKNRSFVISTDSAGWQLGETDLPDLPDDGRHSVYIEANTAKIVPHASGEPLLLTALSRYRGTDVSVFVNLNDWEIVASARDVLRESLNGDVAFFIGNIREIMTLFEAATEDEALAAATRSGRRFAVTAGAEGVHIVRGGTVAHMPAAPIHPSRIVNTLGAGDQFAAGFIAGLVTGMPVMDSALNGIRAATEILQKRDARPDPRTGERLREAAGATQTAAA